MNRNVATGKYKGAGKNISWVITSAGDRFILRFNYQGEEVKQEITYGEDPYNTIHRYTTLIDRGTIVSDKLKNSSRLNDHKLMLCIERIAHEVGYSYELPKHSVRTLGLLSAVSSVSEDLKAEATALHKYLLKIGPTRLAIPERHVEFLRNGSKTLSGEEVDKLYDIFLPKITYFKELRREIIEQLGEIYDKYSDRIIVPPSVIILKEAKPLKEWYS